MKSDSPPGWLVLTCVALGIGSAFFGAYVFCVMWDWFIVPLGMKSISMAHAFGIRGFYQYITASFVPRKIEDEDKTDALIKATVTLVFAPLFTLAFGAFVRLFM